MSLRILAAVSIPSLLLLAIAQPSSAGPQEGQPQGRTESAPTAAGPGQQVLTLALPLGDPQAGREAFHALRCAACHAVAEDESSPPRIDAPAPVLGRVQARFEPGQIATAIVSPSHEINPEARPAMEGDDSPMKEFSDVLTLRQLVDLVAYVRSLGG